MTLILSNRHDLREPRVQRVPDLPPLLWLRDIVTTRYLPDVPPDADPSAWLTWGASAYATTEAQVAGLRREPTTRNPCPLWIRSAAGAWNDFDGAGLEAHDLDALTADLDGARPWLALVPVLRFWTAALAVAAWDCGLLDVAAYPRQGWHSPGDVWSVRVSDPGALLMSRVLRERLRAACLRYRMLHPEHKDCAVLAQIAFTYRAIDAHKGAIHARQD